MKAEVQEGTVMCQALQSAVDLSGLLIWTSDNCM